MKQIEATGKTVDEAIEKGLSELGVDREQVEIEVIEEGKAGFLGMGQRPAHVRLTLKPSNPIEAITFTLQHILELMNCNTKIYTHDEEDGVRLEIVSPDSALIIGKQGKNLSALQYIINKIYNRIAGDSLRIVLDVEGYLERRRESLENMAYRLASKVKRTRRAIKLEPLNPRDRRCIHTALRDNPHVRTFSVGDGQLKRLVIAPRGNSRRKR